MAGAWGTLSEDTSGPGGSTAPEKGRHIWGWRLPILNCTVAFMLWLGGRNATWMVALAVAFAVSAAPAPATETTVRAAAESPSGENLTDEGDGGEGEGEDELAEETCPGASLEPAGARDRRAEAAVLCLINAEREQRDRRALRRSTALERAARHHAEAMVRHHFFSHTGRDGTRVRERVRPTGYLAGARRWALGETLAWGTRGRSRPEAVVAAFMDSPPHRAVLLDRRFEHIGVGLTRGVPVPGQPGPGITLTVNYGTR